MKKATLLAVFFIATLTLTACANKQTANQNFQRLIINLVVMVEDVCRILDNRINKPIFPA